jgi:hypothetical protein
MRRLLTAIALSLSLGVTACYGPFNLSKKLHRWNAQVSGDKFVNWLVFLGLVIVPVYEIALLADALVFNSIEFWSGENPVSPGVGVIRQQDGVVTVEKQGVAVKFVPADDGTILVYREGELVGRATAGPDGRLIATDANGAPIAR